MFKIEGYNVVKSVELRRFKASWPCHNIPDEIEALMVEIDARGDLVDIEYLVEEPNENDGFDDRAPIYFAEEITHDMGAAINALVEDIKAYEFEGKVADWQW